MASYSIVRFMPREGLFVDTDKEDVALAELRTAYDGSHPQDTHVLYLIRGDYDSTPTHIVLEDVIYKLTEVSE